MEFTKSTIVSCALGLLVTVPVGGCDPGAENPAYDDQLQARMQENNAKAAELGLPEVPQGFEYQFVLEYEIPEDIAKELGDEKKLLELVEKPFIHECYEVVDAEQKGGIELPCEKVWHYVLTTEPDKREKEMTQVIEITDEALELFPLK